MKYCKQGATGALERKADCSTVCQCGHRDDVPGCYLLQGLHIRCAWLLPMQSSHCKPWVMVRGCAAGAQGQGGVLIWDAHLLICEMADLPQMTYLWPIAKKANALSYVTMLHSGLLQFPDPEQKLVSFVSHDSLLT